VVFIIKHCQSWLPLPFLQTPHSSSPKRFRLFYHNLLAFYNIFLFWFQLLCTRVRFVCFLMLKDPGLSAFSSSSPSPFSIPKCKKSISKKIVSVMAPQQSERRPATTGSVSFLLFYLFLFFSSYFVLVLTR